MSNELDSLLRTRHSERSLRLVCTPYNEVFPPGTLWEDGDQAGYISIEVPIEVLQQRAQERGFVVRELEGQRRADDKSKVFIVHKVGEDPRGLLDITLWDFKGDGSLLLDNMYFDKFRETFFGSLSDPEEGS